MENIGGILLALLEYNIPLTLSAIAIALPISCVFAFARLSRYKIIAYPARVYVNTLRSMPLVMVMFWIYMVIPMTTGFPLSAYWSALLALACFEIAYFTEIVRSGIQSVPANQRAAALASGLSRIQVARYVVIPQALRRMTPALLTQSLIAFQDSTISSIIGVPETLHFTTIVNSREQDPVFYYTVLAAIFFVVCYSSSRIVRYVESKVVV